MSFELQRQIKNNAQEMREYITDLHQWEQQMQFKQKAKQNLRKNINDESTHIIKQNSFQKKTANKEDNKKTQQEKTERQEHKPLKRDINSISDYYEAWNKFQKNELDKQYAKLEEEELKPYMPYNPYENAKNNICAKPRTKIQIKGSRSSPIVDPTEMKDRGNIHFKVGEYQQAIDCYLECVSNVTGCQAGSLDPGALPDMEASKSKLLSVVFSNLGICSYKLNDYPLSISYLNKSLQFDNSYLKSYIRRAESFKKMGNFKASLKDYLTVKSLEEECGPCSVLGEINALQAYLKRRAKEAREKMITQGQALRGLKGQKIQIQEVEQLGEEKPPTQPNYLEEL